MKILVLGGTGAMGSHLIKLLCDRGDKVVVTSRSDKESKGLIEYRKGNAKNIDFLKDLLCEEWDVIIDFMVYSEKEFSSRVGLLLKCTSQYIFLSSARVYNENKQELKEDSLRLLDYSLDNEFLETIEYSLSKARQEDMLCATEKKNWTIIRPYITYSEKRLQFATLEKESWLYRALRGRSIVICEEFINKLTTLTYGLDVAYGILPLINNKNAYGEAYHITSNVACKWNNILDIYLDVLEDKLGNRPKVIYQDLADFMLWNPGRYQIIYDRLYDRRFDNTKINQFINTESFMQVEEGLRKCLNEFLENPNFLSINWEYEAIKDRYAQERTPLKEIESFKQKVKYLLYRYVIKTKFRRKK